VSAHLPTPPAWYRVDAATWEHLTAWCQRETRTEDEALELRDEIVAYLESCEVLDAEYELGRGWSYVRERSSA